MRGVRYCLVAAFVLVAWYGGPSAWGERPPEAPEKPAAVQRSPDDAAALRAQVAAISADLAKVSERVDGARREHDTVVKASERSIALANTVIGFLVVLVGIATLVIVGLAFFGYDRIQKLTRQTTELLETARKSLDETAKHQQAAAACASGAQDLVKEAEQATKRAEEAASAAEAAARMAQEQLAPIEAALRDAQQRAAVLGAVNLAGEIPPAVKRELAEIGRKLEVFETLGLPLDAGSYLARGNDYYARGEYARAIECYGRAVAIKPDMHEALVNWGVALADQAKTKTGDEADRLLAAAEEKFQAALAVKPDDHMALNNWGGALTDQARTKSGAEADRLFAAAEEKFKAALAIKRDKHEALYNWGVALAYQATMKSGQEADRLLAAAEEKFQAALAIKPDMDEALYNWGLALAHQADARSGEEADRLLAAAADKYEAAVAIKADMHEALNNWCSVLLQRARLKSGEESAGLVVEGREKALQAERLEAGAGAYNLACAEARLGNESGCQRWLETARALGKLPPREHLLKDPDLASVRDKDWFKALVEAVP